MTLEETIAYYHKVVDAVQDNPVPNVGRWCLHNHIKEVLWWLQDYRALKTENDELKWMLKNSLEALDAMAENVRDECGKSACGLCEYDSPLNEYGEMIYECEGVNGKTDCFKWRYHDEAMKLLGGADNAEN